MTSIAVITGVMDQLPQSNCSYINPKNVDYKADPNPAMNYHLLPNSCKLGNGMVVAIVVFTIFVTLSVFVRVPPLDSHVATKVEEVPPPASAPTVQYDQLALE
jgi:hypothetical protein